MSAMRKKAGGPVLNSRELGTVLAALKHWQRCRRWADREMAIASDFGRQHVLNDLEIDQLYARLTND